jgi:hypothetical protein
MRLRSFLLVLALPSAAAMGVSCAPIAFATYDRSFVDGPGGASAGGSPTTIGLTIGAGGGAEDGGAGASIEFLPPPPTTSLSYLCMGGQPKCTPGANDMCAQGGNPMMGDSLLDGGIRSCQVVALGPDAGTTAECRTSGSGPEIAPCSSASDCSPELGCFLHSGVGICGTYCCDSPESCPAMTYCIQGNMAEAPEYQIPVCYPVTQCQLLPDTCPAGSACEIVRQDGTTSCVDISHIKDGGGTEGQHCPCIQGYTCSQQDDLCLKLCSTDSTLTCPAGQDCSCPPGEICQGGTSPYPSNVGICVK